MRILREARAAAGQYDEAVKIAEQVLALSRKIFPPEHAEPINAIEYLAHYSRRAGRTNEAVQLGEQMLELSRQVLGPEDGVTLQRAGRLAYFYRSAGKLDQAVGLAKELVSLRVKTAGPEHATTVEAMMRLADLFADAGRWREARAALEPLRAFRQLPESATIPLMALAALDVLLEERVAHRTLCTVMLTQFGSAMDSETANRVAKACLLLPLEGGERQTAIELAERGVRLGADSPSLPWYLLAQALAQHRAGNWSEAAASAERALELARENPIAPRSAALHAIRSMARHRLGQAETAREALAEAVKLREENWPRVEEGRLGDGWWHDILIAHLLTREATASVMAASSAPAR